MAPNTGIIYNGEKEINLAHQQGIETVPVSQEFALRFESGSTEAQRAAQALQQLKAAKPWLSQIALESQALEAARFRR